MLVIKKLYFSSSLCTFQKCTLGLAQDCPRLYVRVSLNSSDYNLCLFKHRRLDLSVRTPVQEKFRRKTTCLSFCKFQIENHKKQKFLNSIDLFSHLKLSRPTQDQQIWQIHQLTRATASPLQVNPPNLSIRQQELPK